MSTLKEAVGIAPAFDSKTSLAVVSQIHPFSNKSSSLNGALLFLIMGQRRSRRGVGGASHVAPSREDSTPFKKSFYKTFSFTEPVVTSKSCIRGPECIKAHMRSGLDMNSNRERLFGAAHAGTQMRPASRFNTVARVREPHLVRPVSCVHCTPPVRLVLMPCCGLSCAVL